MARKKEKRINLTGGGSLIEVKRAIEDEGQRMRAEMGIVMEEERRTVAPWPGEIVNWWVCALLSAPVTVRDWATVEGRKVWEEHLASPRPIEFRPIPPPCDGAKAVGSVGPVVEGRPIGSHGTGGEPVNVVPKDGRRRPKATRNH